MFREACQLHGQNARACGQPPELVALIVEKRFEAGVAAFPCIGVALALMDIHYRDQRRRLPELDVDIEAVPKEGPQC